MRENMSYNPRYFQLREAQLSRMLAVVRQNRAAVPGGVVFFGDSLTETYPIERCFSHVAHLYNCGIAGAVSEELLWIVDEAVIKYRPAVVVLMVGINDLGNTVMEWDSLTVTWEGGSLVLPQKEFMLLYKMASFPGRIFTRQQLMDEIWGYETDSDAHTVEVHVGRLRERFRDNPDFKIVTIRGVGYKVVKL